VVYLAKHGRHIDDWQIYQSSQSIGLMKPVTRRVEPFVTYVWAMGWADGHTELPDEWGPLVTPDDYDLYNQVRKLTWSRVWAKAKSEQGPSRLGFQPKSWDSLPSIARDSRQVIDAFLAKIPTAESLTQT
jgi:hypothetical protein